MARRQRPSYKPESRCFAAMHVFSALSCFEGDSPGDYGGHQQHTVVAARTRGSVFVGLNCGTSGLNEGKIFPASGPRSEGNVQDSF